MAKSDNSPENHLEWRFYGRRMGRKLTPSRLKLLDELYPKICIDEREITKEGDLAPSSLFQFTPEKIILEIGFGNGERLAEHITLEPKTGFIGAEPFVNGMSAFLKSLDDKESMPDNIRVHMDDAIPLVKSIKSESIDTIMVLNPDPWHKARHSKRRIINQDNLDLFSRILKPNGFLIMTTDVRDLIEHMVIESSNHPDFEWTAKSASDWKNPPKNWISTRYETKGAKGADRMNYLFFKKK